MHISDWSSDVCTSGTRDALAELILAKGCEETDASAKALDSDAFDKRFKAVREDGAYVDAGENDNLIVQKLQANPNRSEEQTSELQSLMRLSYAVFCLKKKKSKTTTSNTY